MKDLVGAQHVALGSDFDGAVTTAFDTTALAAIVDGLLADGWSEDEIRGAMGENALRVLAKTLPVRDASPGRSGASPAGTGRREPRPASPTTRPVGLSSGSPACPGWESRDVAASRTSRPSSGVDASS